MNNSIRSTVFYIVAAILLVAFTIGYGRASEVHSKAAMVDWMVNHSGHNVKKNVAIDIADNVLKQSREQNIDPFLLLSLIKNESSFNANAKSGYGARGLMQVVPRYHRDKIKNRSITNIRTNIQVGTTVLSDCIDRAKGAITKALHCYSGGARNYTSKLRKTYNEINRYHTKYRFKNELPVYASNSFLKPRGTFLLQNKQLVASL